MAQQFFIERKVALHWDAKHVAECEDASFIYFGIQDGAGKEIFRFDARPESPEARGLVAAMTVSIRSASMPSKARGLAV